MKKHTWLAPTLWFALPTLLLCAVQLALAVFPLLAANDTPTFVGGVKYLGLLLGDRFFLRFLLNSLLVPLITPLLLSLVGGIFWLFLRKAPLSSPLRYSRKEPNS